MHPAKCNDVGIGFPGSVTQPKRITHIVRDVLNLRHLIVVRQDDGISLLFESADFFRQVVTCAERNHLIVSVWASLRQYSMSVRVASTFWGRKRRYLVRRR